MYKRKILDKVTKIVKLGGMVSFSCSHHFSLMKYCQTDIYENLTKSHMTVINIKVGAP
jgi:hypothetical protein